jgi:general stress protein CsbA
LLWSIFALVLALYLICLFTEVTFGGALHLALIALVVIVIFAVKSDREKL